MPTETEIKLRLTDAAPVLERIASMGYSARGPRELEQDQLYDRANASLRAGGQALRLRTRGSRVTLTYKGPAQRGPHKSREEIELDVTDGAAFEAILAALGYYPTFRYEKYRTTHVKVGEPGIITLDETPIGMFLELEGAGDWIDRTAHGLGFFPTDFVTDSYARIYAEFRKTNPTVPANMLF